VALSKADALSPELLKEQVARLKRAAKRMPIVLSSASGEGVEAALRALFVHVEEARRDEDAQNAPVEETGWRP
jgi:GTP-binding protein